MTTRYARKNRRSPCPQATPIKTFNFLLYLSLGIGRFGIPPCPPPSSPYFARCSQSAANLFCRKNTLEKM